MNADSTAARAICGARNRKGEPCGNLPLAGKKRCRMHGGLSKRGVESPRWKNGKYSTAVRDGMTARSKELMDDKDLLDPRRAAASQLEAMEALEEMVAEKDSPQWRRESLSLFRAWKRAEDEDKAAALEALDEHLHAGCEVANALVGICTVAEMLSRVQSRWWALASSAARAISKEEVFYILATFQRILSDEFANGPVSRAMARADRECTGGVLGFAEREAQQDGAD